MRYGKLAAAGALALVMTTGTAGALAGSKDGGAARAEARAATYAPSFASAFERVWGFLLGILGEARGTVVPGDGGEGGESIATPIGDDGV